MADKISSDFYIEQAEKMFLFTDMNKKFVTKAISEKGCETFLYKKGETIFKPDEFQAKLGLVIKGSVRVYGEQVLLNIINTGSVFGAAAVFGQIADYCSLILASNESIIMFFNEELIRQLITDNGNIALNYVKFLSDRIRFLNKKIDTFTADNTKSRLLKYLASQAELQDDLEGEIILPISCQKLAETLNIGRASLYRAFDQLENDGLIRKDGKIVKIYTTI